jgi:hypothetical protein
MNGPNWLMMMNYALVLVVVLAWLGLFLSVGWELAEKRLRRALEMGSVDSELSAMLTAESHRISVPELGLTMADGGVEVKASDHDSDTKKK